VRRLLFLFAVLLPSAGAQPNPVQQLIEAARTGPATPEFKNLLAGAGVNNRGTGFVWGQDFLFAISGESAPVVSINGEPPQPMHRIPESNLWYKLVKMRTGVTHAFQFFADSKPLAPRSDISGYNPDSYPRPGVAKGQVSEKKVITSKIYPGMTADYWIYVSPGYDPTAGAALMVWQDGQNLATGDRSRYRLFTVTENLIHQKLIPPMIHVMIAPGTAAGRSMRSIEYDTVSDRYGRFLLEELLPEVEKIYKIRPDGYSRAIAGESSGGICAFNTAWFFPEKFSRVHSVIGSFTSIQWKFGNANPAENIEGGNVYPFKVRKEPKRNIRVWMSDGSEDLENSHGSWPLQNIQLANSLKMREYDFHFRFGESAHNGSQAALDLPESLAWLWRDYNPAKKEQTYEMDPAERSKPYYRVRISNRDAW
jgi:enterochelin esterase family protein